MQMAHSEIHLRGVARFVAAEWAPDDVRSHAEARPSGRSRLRRK